MGGYILGDNKYKLHYDGVEIVEMSDDDSDCDSVVIKFEDMPEVIKLLEQFIAIGKRRE